jgi:hypothetical protein
VRGVVQIRNRSATIPAAERSSARACSLAIGTTTETTMNTTTLRQAAALVLDCLTALAILTLLAGRATRRAWDALPVLSEALGRWYSRLLVGKPEALPLHADGQETQQGAAEGARHDAEIQGRQPAQRQARTGQGARREEPQAGDRHRAQRGRTTTAPRTLSELEQLTCRQLMALTGTRRKLAKRQLIELAMAC